MTPIKTPAGEILSIRAEAGSTFEIKRKESMPLHIMVTKPNGQSYPINLPEGNWQILGPISHKGEFGFDPEPFVESMGNGWYADYKALNFEDHPYYYPFKDPTDSFVSLIESQEEILWSNPDGDKPNQLDYKGQKALGIILDEARYLEDLRIWQSNESKRLTEKEQVIILKKVNR